jgi:hypothetical protein
LKEYPRSVLVQVWLLYWFEEGEGRGFLLFPLGLLGLLLVLLLLGPLWLYFAVNEA